jgi:hypothetical protein
VETVGLCARCGNYLCEVCRSPWGNRVLCAACVDRALGARERAPDQDRSHLRQAWLALAFAAAAWAAGALAVPAAGLAAAGGDGRRTVLVAVLLLLVVAAGVLPAALGVGLAAAALRVPGGHRALATFGLVVGGLYVGVVLGLGALDVWQR